VREAAPETTRERAPRDYTPNHIVEKILQSRSAIEGERKQVTVLFADVKGSMELAEGVDPEAWHSILDRFFQILTDGVHRFEGTVNQYTGDGIMALFGAPIAHEDHAQRACYAALFLSNELRRYARQLRLQQGLSFSVRMGLNSGEVIVGKIGDDLRMDYTAQGHTVNLAARMEQLAEPGKIYLAKDTAKFAEGFFEFEDLGLVRVSGVRDPVQVFELQGLGALRTRLDVSRTRGFSKFVGRGNEMATLEAALDQAIQGNGQVVGVVGEAGVGKSRLCFEFAERCRARGLAFYETHAISHGKAIPFLPILELFRSYFGITEQDNEEIARDKIAGRSLRLDEGLADALPLVFDFLGVPDPRKPALQTDPEARRREFFGAMKRLTHARSQREPAVFLVEDLHWLDGGSEGFLENLVESLPGTRTLVLVNFRPEYHASWLQKSYYQQLSLAPLGAEAVCELLRHLLGDDPTVARLPDMIQARTQGNPFFIEEVVQSLVEAGTLEGSKGAYLLIEPVAELTVPATVQTVLASRIDRLQERDKQVLQTAAVIGKKFSEAVLREVVELPEHDLAGTLRSLISNEFIYEEALYPEVEYTFKHPVTQEVALSSQLADRRRRIHQRVAQALEELEHEKLDNQAALLAHHWEEAGEALVAARWHRQAAVWAGANHAIEALRHWRKVRTMLQGIPETTESLTLGVEACGQMLLFSSRLGGSEEEVDRLYTEAKEFASRSGDTRAIVLARIHYGFFKALSGRIAEAKETYEEAGCLLGNTGDSELRNLLSYSVGTLKVSIEGNCKGGLPLVEGVIAFTEGRPQFGSDVFGYPVGGMCVVWRGLALGLMGRLNEAVREIDRAIAIGREGQPPTMIMACWAYATIGDLLGDTATMMARARRSVELATMDSFAKQSLSLGLLLKGEWNEAIHVLKQALDTCRDRGTYRCLEPRYLTNLAQAYMGSGDLQAARTTAEEAVRLTAAHGWQGVDAYLTLALVLLESEGAKARYQIEAALAGAQQKVDSSGATSRQPYLSEARGALARLLGDEHGEARHLREAHRLFIEMGATGHARRLGKELGL
jgi:class 3 adenylate cyclase/tetratricopeptide (TPR) repeat protein